MRVNEQDTSVSSLLISLKMLLSVGFVIIAVVILGVLLGALVHIHNYRNGTKLRAGQILKDTLISLWNQSMKLGVKKYNSRKNL